MAQRTWRFPLLLTGAALAIALGACGDPDPVEPIAGPSGSTASADASGATPQPGASNKPPANSPLPTKAGAPAVCTELQKAKMAEAVSTAIRELADPATTAAGKKRMEDAVASLVSLAGKAENPLKGSLSKLGAALTALAQKGMEDPAALEAAGTAALELDDEVLATCGFPMSDA
jgi:hypothetical protein